MPAPLAAAAVSSLIGATGSMVVAQKQRSSQKRIAKRQEENRARATAAEKRTAEQGKEAQRVATKLQTSKKRDIQNEQLATRGISQFGDISEAVLTDRTT